MRFRVNRTVTNRWPTVCRLCKHVLVHRDAVASVLAWDMEPGLYFRSSVITSMRSELSLGLSWTVTSRPEPWALDLRTSLVDWTFLYGASLCTPQDRGQQHPLPQAKKSELSLETVQCSPFIQSPSLENHCL